jgi:hypothetical protein
MKASKLVHNINIWTSVSKEAQTGILVRRTELNKSSYFFGLEEWNNCKILRKHKLAYLDSFRSFARLENYERIELLNFNNGIVYHIGTLYGVKRIKCLEIPEIKKILNSENWLIHVENDFNAILDLREITDHDEYMHCWNSEDIVAPINKGFIVNIRYDRLIFFDNPINLTELNPNINQRWRRLIQLYEVPQNLENLFNL